MAPQVLVVDPDTSAAQITSAVVQRIAPTAVVVCVRSPEEGWAHAQRDRPDVLIIDPSPHGAAGRLLMELCRDASPATRIVVLASAPTPSLRTRAAQLKVESYIEKPAAPALLIDQLRGVLQQETLAPLAPALPAAAQR